MILFFLALVFLGVGSAEDDEVCGLISGSGTAKKKFVKSKHSYEYFKKLVKSPGGGGCSTASIISATSMGSSGSSSTSGSGVGVGVIGFSSGSDF